MHGQGNWDGSNVTKDILENGVDADGDGKVNLQSSTRDALFSAAKMLKSLGWKANEPWLQEVTLTKELIGSIRVPIKSKLLKNG